MPRLITTITVLGFALAPAGAWAQAPGPPQTELGVQASMQTGERHALSWSPRFTLSLTPKSALEFTADVRPARSDPSAVRTSSQWYAVHLRQLLFQRGRWQLYGVVGAGAGQTTQAFPGGTIDVGNGSVVTFPPGRFREAGLAAHVGAAAQYEVAGRLAVRADVRATASNTGGLRAMIGGVVPIGRRFRADSSRTNLMDDDSLANGLVIGAASGAATTAALAGFYSVLLCEQDDCDGFFVSSVLVGAAIGTAIGGVLGGVIDSLIPGKRK
jgi:hypothetical protein